MDLLRGFLFCFVLFLIHSDLFLFWLSSADTKKCPQRQKSVTKVTNFCLRAEQNALDSSEWNSGWPETRSVLLSVYAVQCSGSVLVYTGKKTTMFFRVPWIALQGSPCLLIEWLIDWLVERFIHWLVHWWIGWLIGWPIYSFMDYLIDWLIDWLIDGSYSKNHQHFVPDSSAWIPPASQSPTADTGWYSPHRGATSSNPVSDRRKERKNRATRPSSRMHCPRTPPPRSASCPRPVGIQTRGYNSRSLVLDARRTSWRPCVVRRRWRCSSAAAAASSSATDTTTTRPSRRKYCTKTTPRVDRETVALTSRPRAKGADCGSVRWCCRRGRRRRSAGRRETFCASGRVRRKSRRRWPGEEPAGPVSERACRSLVPLGSDNL